MPMITFTKVDLAYGWLGNMSPHRVKHLDRWWETTEALFQALRFEDENVREEIRKAKSPMTAKMKAKAHAVRHLRRVEPASPEDLANMRLVLRLKIKYHPRLKADLLATGDAQIIEDCSARAASPWGARKIDGQWEGENLLGKLWMKLREEFRREAQGAPQTNPDEPWNRNPQPIPRDDRGGANPRGHCGGPQAVANHKSSLA